MRVSGHGLLGCLVIAVIGAAFSSAAFGQEPRRIGGSGITVFKDRDFRGSAVTFQQDRSSLSGTGFENSISSIRVGPGEEWEVCERPNFRGNCIVVSGEESDLRRNNWDNRISSLRRAGSGGNPGNPGQASPPSWARGTWYWTNGPDRRMTIDRNGRITLFNSGRTSYGTYRRDGTIFLDGITSNLTRRGGGIQTYNQATGETSDYSRDPWSGGGGGNVSRPPSWAVGNWRWVNGPNRTMIISANGDVTLYNNGITSNGKYYNGTVTIDGLVSTVSRNGNRIRTYNQATGEYSDYRRQ